MRRREQILHMTRRIELLEMLMTGKDRRIATLEKKLSRLDWAVMNRTFDKIWEPGV